MKQGFSLVELSIVLVILGLLTGGILAGQSLIRASELRAVSTEYERYAAAANTFRDKYFSIPGDFRDATRFWGRLVTTADCVTNSAAAGPNANGTCDGNGDGLMATGSGANVSSEHFQFWRQLALAGLVEGTYSGITGPQGTIHAVIGTNSPRSKLNSAGWNVSYYDNSGGAGVPDFAINFGNQFLFGQGNNAGNNATTIAALVPSELWNIDTKMDDGKPGRGKVIGSSVTACTDGANNTVLDANYDLQETAIACSARFRQQF